MTDITSMKIDEYAVVMENGSKATIAELGGIPEAGAWIIMQLEEMISSGENTGESMTAREAVLAIADKIEFDELDDAARKPTADVLRYLSQFVLQHRVPLS